MNCHLLLFSATTMNPFSIRLWRTMKSGFYMTAGDDQLSGWTEKKLQSTSQSQTCTKKRSRSLVVYYPSDPLQLSESWRNHYIWEVCSANQWAAENCSTCSCIGQQKGPNSSPGQCLTTSHNQCFKNLKTWATGFCLIHHIHLTSRQLNTISLRVLRTFCRKNTSTTSRRQKLLSKSSKHRFSCYRNKQTYFSLAKMCWL